MSVTTEGVGKNPTLGLDISICPFSEGKHISLGYVVIFI
jgi:hypothetical protein